MALYYLQLWKSHHPNYRNASIMASAKLYLDTRRARKDGTYPLKIAVTHRSTFMINLKIYLREDQLVGGQVVKHKDRASHNGRIIDKLKCINDDLLALYHSRELKTLSSKQLKAFLERPREGLNLVLPDLESERIDFFEFAETIIAELKRKGKEGTAERWHLPTISQLRKFKYPLYTSDINVRFLKNFQKFLEDKGVGYGANNYMRSFRSLFNKAREFYNDEDRGLIRIPQYPFARYKMPYSDKNSKRKSRAESKKKRLTLEELRQFINYTPTEKRKQFTRDMCLLMFYLIGINAKDLYYCSKPVDGRINYSRAKTEKEYSIKLEPEAIEIISKYSGKDGYLIDANQRYSDHLNFTKVLNTELHGDKDKGSNGKKKVVIGIFQELEIKKHANITTNWFRHTWATIARNDCKISKNDVALCLGHEDGDNRVTDIYLDDDYSIIDKSNRTVIDHVLMKKPVD